MPLDMYDDRVIFDIYDSETGEIEHEFELDDDRGIRPRGKSHYAKLRTLVSHWCPDCECAFRKTDINGPNPKCPICGTSLDKFDLEVIVPDYGLDIEQDDEGNWESV